MSPTDRPDFAKALNAVLAAYMKPASVPELEAWWMTCRVFTLHDVERALAAHQMDPDDGKRAPRPIDVKRRLVSGVVERPKQADPHFAERIALHYERSIRSPSVVATAHAIALRHGNKPWQGTYATAETPQDVIE